MPLITYKFADGHTEEIEVSFEVAEAYMQILKYERCSKRRDRDKLKSLEKLAEKDLTLRRKTQIILKFRKNGGRKSQLDKLLTPRQAEAYFLFQYLKIKKVEIAKSMGVTEGAVRKLILKAQKNLQAQRIERDKELLLLRAIFGPRP